MDFRVKVYSKIQRNLEKKTTLNSDRTWLFKKKRRWHHHDIIISSQLKEEKNPHHQCSGCWFVIIFSFWKKNASFFRPSCADDLEYQSHVTGRKKFYGSWANKSLHLWMGCFVYLLGVLGRFYWNVIWKINYDVFCQVDFLVVLYYGEGLYFKILSCCFSCYVDTDLVADEGLPAEFLVDWVGFFN